MHTSMLSLRGAQSALKQSPRFRGRLGIQRTNASAFKERVLASINQMLKNECFGVQRADAKSCLTMTLYWRALLRENRVNFVDRLNIRERLKIRGLGIYARWHTSYGHTKYAWQNICTLQKSLWTDYHAPGMTAMLQLSQPEGASMAAQKT